MADEFTIIDRSGHFQCIIVDYGLKELDSGAVAIPIRAQLTAFWNGESWDDWTSYNVHAYGDVWIVKKDGNLNTKQVESLCKFAGWDGYFNSILNNTWQPAACQVTINEETYQDKVSYKIAFINQFDRTPGGLAKMDETKAKSLAAKYGSQLRALAGPANRNSAPTAGKPPAPPSKGVPANQTKAAMAAAGDDEIPF